MIARKHRFRGHNSVSRVRGKSVRLPLISVFYAKNTKRQEYRMAVVVSKKVAKSAVTRNRIRRRLYELVRTSDLDEQLPVDMVFVVKNESVATIPHEELQKQVSSALQDIQKL